MKTIYQNSRPLLPPAQSLKFRSIEKIFRGGWQYWARMVQKIKKSPWVQLRAFTTTVYENILSMIEKRKKFQIFIQNCDSKFEFKF